MKIWYSCKIKHSREMENGGLKQVTEVYLLDAVSYTEAESRIYAICEEHISGEFAVTQITKTNIADVVFAEEPEKWFKCKVVYVTVDGDSGKEVRVNTYLLVAADDLRKAYDEVQKFLGAMVVPYEIPSITLTNILEVHPYEAAENQAIPSNLRPISEVMKEE